jgi:hypothetical protein
MSQAEHVPLVPPADSEHDCPSCGHACRQLERDFALFMQTGSFLVDREGQLRDTEHARRLGLAVARALGPRWTQRGRMIEEGTQR